MQTLIDMVMSSEFVAYLAGILSGLFIWVITMMFDDEDKEIK